MLWTCLIGTKLQIDHAIALVQGWPDGNLILTFKWKVLSMYDLIETNLFGFGRILYISKFKMKLFSLLRIVYWMRN